MYFLLAEKKNEGQNSSTGHMTSMPWTSAKKHQYVSFDVENNLLFRSLEFVLADKLVDLLKQHNIWKEKLWTLRKTFTRTVQHCPKYAIFYRGKTCKVKTVKLNVSTILSLYRVIRDKYDYYTKLSHTMTCNNLTSKDKCVPYCIFNI